MLNCIAIDDEPLALQLIEGFAHKTPGLSFLAAFPDPQKALPFLTGNQVDLIFLDIDMREANGVVFARQLTQPPMIIFTTAYKDYALEGFELDAVDFLLKPFDHTRFARAVDKAMERQKLRNAPPGFITVYEEYKVVQILLDDIEYIESMQDYVKIHLFSGRIVFTLSTLKAMADRLPQDRFMRIHRSYIVALRQIRLFNKKRIELISGTVINVGERYTNDVVEYLKSNS